MFARERTSPVPRQRPSTSLLVRSAASAGEKSVSCRPVRLRTRGGNRTSRARAFSASRGLRTRVFAGVVVRCRAVATSQMFPESLGSTFGVLQRPTSNQAMQLTASKPNVHALRVCHPRSGCVERYIGLAAADLVTRQAYDAHTGCIDDAHGHISDNLRHRGMGLPNQAANRLATSLVAVRVTRGIWVLDRHALNLRCVQHFLSRRR